VRTHLLDRTGGGQVLSLCLLGWIGIGIEAGPDDDDDGGTGGRRIPYILFSLPLILALSAVKSQIPNVSISCAPFPVSHSYHLRHAGSRALHKQPYLTRPNLRKVVTLGKSCQIFVTR
jgi:hypothetical protein